MLSGIERVCLSTTVFNRSGISLLFSCVYTKFVRNDCTRDTPTKERKKDTICLYSRCVVKATPTFTSYSFKYIGIWSVNQHGQRRAWLVPFSLSVPKSHARFTLLSYSFGAPSSKSFETSTHFIILSFQHSVPEIQYTKRTNIQSLTNTILNVFVRDRIAWRNEFLFYFYSICTEHSWLKWTSYFVTTQWIVDIFLLLIRFSLHVDRRSEGDSLFYWPWLKTVSREFWHPQTGSRIYGNILSSWWINRFSAEHTRAKCIRSSWNSKTRQFNFFHYP